MAAMESRVCLEAAGARVQRLRPALGTWVAIDATAPSETAAAAAIESAYREIAGVDQRLHPRRDGSELARLHSAPLRTAVRIEGTTWELLQLSQRIHALSEGVFDPCLPSHPGRLSDLTLSRSAAGPHWALCRVPLALDLGGIAKGYAVDRAIEALRAAGCESGLVNAGGDLRTFGRSETVWLRRADGSCSPWTLNEQALAVSDLDTDLARRPGEHQGYYRRSTRGGPIRRYAAVVAGRAAVADALTKCVLLAEEPCVLRTLRALGARCIG